MLVKKAIAGSGSEEGADPEVKKCGVKSILKLNYDDDTTHMFM